MFSIFLARRYERGGFLPPNISEYGVTKYLLGIPARYAPNRSVADLSPMIVAFVLEDFVNSNIL